MKRPRYRRLRRAGAQWHGRKDCISVFIVRRIRPDGSISLRWQNKSGQLRISCDQPACILFTHKNHAI